MTLTVMLAGLPCFLEDVLAAALEGAGAAVVRVGAPRDGDLVAAAREGGADAVVVCRETPSDLGAIDGRLAEAASVPVLALTPTIDGAVLHRWVGCGITDVTARAIVDALESAAAGSPRRR